jgi:hypothetical protein
MEFQLNKPEPKEKYVPIPISMVEDLEMLFVTYEIKLDDINPDHINQEMWEKLITVFAALRSFFSHLSSMTPIDL